MDHYPKIGSLPRPAVRAEADQYPAPRTDDDDGGGRRTTNARYNGGYGNDDGGGCGGETTTGDRDGLR